MIHISAKSNVILTQQTKTVSSLKVPQSLPEIILSIPLLLAYWRHMSRFPIMHMCEPA